MPTENSKKRIPELLELVGLTQHSKKRLRTFSKGMLQRIGLAQAMLNYPELVILDEPTSGLRSGGEAAGAGYHPGDAASGTTVFLNSHLLSEVEITCDRVAFIKHGKVIHTSAIQSLIEGELTVAVRRASLHRLLCKV